MGHTRACRLLLTSVTVSVLRAAFYPVLRDTSRLPCKSVFQADPKLALHVYGAWTLEPDVLCHSSASHQPL